MRRNSLHGAMSFPAHGGHSDMIQERLAKTLDGDVLVAGDPGYDAARAVWNAMVDRRPRLIARCRTVADVRAAVLAARDLSLEIGVRCGGHSVVGLGIPDDGLMIDLTPMGVVSRRSDSEARTGAGRRIAGCARQDDPAAWVGNNGRQCFTYGSRWPDPRRRHGLAGPAVRPFLRQRRGVRDGHSGRRRHTRKPDGERRPLLGTARWRWQLRRRHRI